MSDGGQADFGEPNDWVERNKSALSDEIDDVYRILEAFLTHQPLPQDVKSLPGAPTLNQLAVGLKLSKFERQLLLMVTGMELDGRFSSLLSRTGASMNFALALAAFPDAHWSILSPGAPLRYWRLVTLGPDRALVHSPLRVDDTVLSFLLGQPTIDEALTAHLSALPPAALLAPSQLQQVASVVRLWQPQSEMPVIQLISGSRGGVAAAVAAQACRELRFPLMALSTSALPADSEALEGLIRLCERQCLLSGAVLVLDDGESSGDEATDRTIRRLIDRIDCPIILTSWQRRRLERRMTVTLEIGKPSAGEQAADWIVALGGADGDAPQARRLAAQFYLERQDIKSVEAEARSLLTATSAEGAGELSDALWHAARRHARPKLDGLAQRIDVEAGWQDLVLPGSQMRILQTIAAQIQHRSTIYDDWGFFAGGERGLGLAALFAGSSGTGKTTAAEVLASELKLDLYRVDLSQIASKYIGETEKNLRRVFDAAEQGGVILLFDEADALFGKRTEVRESHDRYANQEVSYLLQRVETFRGLAILTSNLRSNIDAAFMRRLRFVVTFPFPDAAMRRRIWQRIFPAQTPTQDLDMARLAQLNLSGGQIRTVALNAAFLAAGDGGVVGMRHIRDAAHMEYAKQEKILSDVELQGWPS